LKSAIRNPKSEITIEILLILLLVFTPIAFGSQVIWAFSLMELGILLIIILWAIKLLLSQILKPQSSILSDPQASNLAPQSSIRLPILLSLFLAIVLLQMIPLPAGIVKIISPKTYELRNQLSVTAPVTDVQSEFRNPKSEMLLSSNPNPVKSTIGPHPQSSNLKPQSSFTLTLFPFTTKIRFFQWLALAGLFIFLLHWKLSDNRYRISNSSAAAATSSMWTGQTGFIQSRGPFSTATASRAISSWSSH